MLPKQGLALGAAYARACLSTTQSTAAEHRRRPTFHIVDLPSHVTPSHAWPTMNLQPLTWVLTCAHARYTLAAPSSREHRGVIPLRAAAPGLATHM